MRMRVSAVLLASALHGCDGFGEVGPDRDAPSGEEAAPSREVAAPKTKPEVTDVDDEDDAAGIAVPFPQNALGIPVPVTLEGPSGRVELPYGFNTAAALLTITTETAHQLGIEVPADAPTANIITGAGRRTHPLVRVPAVELGDVRLEGVLATVCNACADESRRGWLGLNALRAFRVQVEVDADAVRLTPRPQEGRPNQAHEVLYVVELRLKGEPNLYHGKFHWTIEVRNRSDSTLLEVVPRIDFDGGVTVRGTEIDRIAPSGTGESVVEGRVPSGGNGHYVLELDQAYW